MRYLKFEACENLTTGLSFLIWTVRAQCPVCQTKHATMFHKKPDLKAVLEAKFLPCSKCMKELEKEWKMEEEQEKGQKEKG
jgi:hypothetical protein